MATSNKRVLTAALVALISFVGLLLTPGLAAADPDPSDPAATPSLSEVQQQIVDMQQQLETVTEQYNDAKIKLGQDKAAAAAADATYQASLAKVADAKAKLAAMAVDAYKGTPLAGLTTLISSASPQEVLDRLNTLDQISGYNNSQLAALVAVQTQAQQAKAAADAATAQTQKTADSMAGKKADIEKKLPTLQAKLASLTAPQRTAVLAASGGQAVTPTDTAPAGDVAGAPSPAAAAAVEAALSRRGMPYVWAAAGPSSFDCSGLTMWSYAQAGIGLPHSSSSQRGSGPSVSLSALLPGDLVFMPGHVGMYIGNGQVIHAPTPGDVVKVVALSSMHWSFANRPSA